MPAGTRIGAGKVQRGKPNRARRRCQTGFFLSDVMFRHRTGFYLYVPADSPLARFFYPE